MFLAKRLFLESLLSGGKTVDLRSNMEHVSERTLKELSRALFRDAVALLVHELCGFVEKMMKSAKFDLW